MAAKKLKAPSHSVQQMLDEYGKPLVEKVVTAEGPGAAGAAANLYRTLVEWSIPKPTQRLDVDFSGFKIVDVE